MNKKAEVAYVAPATMDVSSVIIPNSITIESGENFIVTSIADNAFKGKKKLTKVYIGKRRRKESSGKEVTGDITCINPKR